MFQHLEQLGQWVFPVDTVDLILKGVLVGIVVSAPMGPVGVLCVQRTLNKGRWYGFVTGLGAALSDIFYALIVGVGMSFVNDFINNERNLFVLKLAGSVMLLVFGVLTFRSHPQDNIRPKSQKKGSLWSNFWTGFVITFSNPLIVFLFIALFARFAFVVPDHPLQQTIGYASIMGGAVLWWLFLTWGVEKIKSQFQVRGIWLLNRTIGTVVIVAAIIGLFMTIYGLSLY